MNSHFINIFESSFNNKIFTIYNLLSSIFFWLGLNRFIYLVKNNFLLFYKDHVSKYYIYSKTIENDVQVKTKILKLIKVKLFLDFILNIHLNVNNESNNIILHNYFNNFHVLILYGSCFEIKYENTLGVQVFKREIGYYNKYLNTNINKIIYGKHEYHVMSDNSKYFFKFLFDYIKNYKLFNKNFCVTLTKQDYNTYNEAKFFEYGKTSESNYKNNNELNNDELNNDDKNDDKSNKINNYELKSEFPIKICSDMEKYYIESF